MLHFHAVPNVLRDLLISISPLPVMDDFALGGGTSLALRFGHRVSVDLDFFTTSEFDASELAGLLSLPEAKEVNRAANTLSLDVRGMKLDFLRHAYPILEPVEQLEDLRLVSLPDVAAMKLNAIANRGAKKDFFDLAELSKHHPLVGMLEWFERKYTGSDRFTVIRSLTWFEDAEMEPDPISLTGRDWKSVKAVIRRMVAEIE